MNKKISKNINKKNQWTFMWSSSPVMSNYWSTSQALLSRADIYGSGRVFCYFDGDITTAYMEKSQLEKFKKKGKKYLDPVFLKQYRSKYKIESTNWWKWIRKIEKINYVKSPVSEVIEDHKKFIKYSVDSIAYFGSTRHEFTYAAEEKLKNLIKKHYTSNYLDIFGVLTSSASLDDIQKENLDWLRLIDKKTDAGDMLKHVSKYPWLVFGQFDDNKVFKFLKDKIKKEQSVADENIYNLKRLKNNLRKQQNKIFSEFGKDTDEAKYLANFLQSQAVERMNIKAYWAGAYYLARRMWLKIAEITKISVEDLFRFVTPVEIEELLRVGYSGNIKNLINDRRNSHALIILDNQVKIFGSKEADKFFNRWIAKNNKTLVASYIKGQTAMPGLAKGKVRKVVAGDLDMLQESIKKFKKGEIFITSMTQPNMMVIAKKAAAIITDEGGITSHAAIISRELKIPCIVGCLHAMQLFKDGDLVEVDANNGVVRKLN